MKKLTNSVLALTLAGLGLVLTPGTASADFMDFTVDPSVYGPTGTQFDADRIVGGYSEAFTVTDVDLDGSGNVIGGSFVTDAFYNVGQFFIDSEAPGGGVEIEAGESGEGVDYSLYALFTATGTFAENAEGGFTFTATGGRIDVYVDNDRNTTLAFVPAIPAYNAATDDITRGNTGDDERIAEALLAFGEGIFREGDANGDFSLTFNPFSLLGSGFDYFVAPDPFYVELLLEGQFNTFVPAIGTVPVITGSADASFSGVPEPASLTLLGLGLAGTGWMARRRRKA